MRKYTLSLDRLLVIILTITLFGCSSDDETIVVQNDFTNTIEFDGQTYQISGGFSEYSGSHNEFSMALFPSGITIDTNDYTIHGGDWFLETEPLLTKDNTIEGTYTAGIDVNVYFIDNAQFVDDELQPGKKVYEPNKNGTLTINKLDSEYEFIYKAYDDRDTVFTAYYKGPFIQR